MPNDTLWYSTRYRAYFLYMSYPVLLFNLYDIAYLPSKGIIFWEHEFTNPKLYHLKHTLKMLNSCLQKIR